jgi:hypothetical protein
VSGSLRRTMARWLEAARTIGFFLLLVLGSAACGLAIAWPLWLFATAERRLFSIFILCLAVAVLAAVVVRAIIRRRRARRDPGRPLRALLAVLLTILIVAVALGGAYLAAALFYRGMPIFAVPLVLAWAGLLWLLGFLLGRTKVRKAGAQPAENRSE